MPLGHPYVVFAVALSELDGRPVLASGGSDRTVRAWDLAAAAPIGGPIQLGSPVHALVAAQSRVAVATAADGLLAIDLRPVAP